MRSIIIDVIQPDPITPKKSLIKIYQQKLQKSAIFVAACSAFLGACKTNSGSDIASAGGNETGLPAVKQWQVMTNQGEMILPDIFYAHPFQNMQIMPTSLILKGSEVSNQNPPQPTKTQPLYQINRMIYPTIGNPNLFMKDQSDQFIIVLSLESSIVPTFSTSNSTQNGREVTINESSTYKPMFYVGTKQGRPLIEKSAAANSNAIDYLNKPYVHLIKPSQIIVKNKDKIPTQLQHRTTIIFIFNQDSLKGLDPNLYDVKFNLIKNVQSPPNQTQGTYESVIYNEFAYNALKIFPKGINQKNYEILNITDSQISLGGTAAGRSDNFLEDTLTQTQTFVTEMKRLYGRNGFLLSQSSDSNSPAPAFITFNGDLHNGGSPFTLEMYDVASTYRNEATSIMEMLRELPIPIFLTAGNHDGIASTGVEPFDRDQIHSLANTDFVIKSLGKREIALNKPSDFFGFSGSSYSSEAIEDAGKKKLKEYFKYLKSVKSTPGGRHLNTFSGNFVRSRSSFASRGSAIQDWAIVPAKAQNMMLYDGFNQWHQTYGPSYMSWTYGKNHFVSINTYDLRQHRRTGWGMYNVNYGGGISHFQMGWLAQELSATGLNKDLDIVMLAHHDPRGGHNGHDYPFYFRQIEYRGMGDSITNYITGEVLNPIICGLGIPESLKTKKFSLGCMHDGLQEWMRHDAEFDCVDSLLIPRVSTNNPLVSTNNPLAYDKICDIQKIKNEDSITPYYSGYAMIHRLSETKNLRTLLLGHTHYSSIEVYQSGSKLIPDSVVLDISSDKKYRKKEAQRNTKDKQKFDAKKARLQRIKTANPLRAISSAKQGQKTPRSDIKYDEDGYLRFYIRKNGHGFTNTLQDHELVILRLTSVANLSSQMFKGKDLFGYSHLQFMPSDTSTTNGDTQLNKVTLKNYDTAESKYEFSGKDEQNSTLVINRSQEVRYRKLSEIKIETDFGSSRGAEKTVDDLTTDFERLTRSGYNDKANIWREIYQLKTEGEDK